MKIKIKNYYALLCPAYEKVIVLCGIYSTKAEASLANKATKDCPIKHKIKKCQVTVEYK